MTTVRLFFFVIVGRLLNQTCSFDVPVFRTVRRHFSVPSSRPVDPIVITQGPLSTQIWMGSLRLVSSHSVPLHASDPLNYNELELHM